MMNDGNVVMSLEDYRRLVTKGIKYDMLLAACFEKPELSWDKKQLHIEDDCLVEVLKVMDPEAYEEAFLALKSEEEDE